MPLLAVAVIAAAVVSIGLLPEEPSPWAFGWEAMVAIGTILLATGTLAVALVTRSTAQATKTLAAETKSLVDATAGLAKISAEEVEISRRALQGDIKPIMADFPNPGGRPVAFRIGGGTKGSQVSVPACNVGAGAALIKQVTMHWDEPGAVVSPTTYMGSVTVLAVPPGGETEARFDFPSDALARVQALHELGKFWVEISYVDATNDQAEITRLDLYRHSKPGVSPGYRIWAMSIRREGETEPYIESRPANR